MDYAARIAALEKLEEINSQSAESRSQSLIADMDSGGPKMFVISQALRLRRDRPEIFVNGNYAPLEISGNQARHLFAYLRHCPTGVALIAVPRLLASLEGSSDATQFRVCLDAEILLPPEWANQAWKNVLTGEDVIANNGHLSAAVLFQHFPVALLAMR